MITVARVPPFVIGPVRPTTDLSTKAGAEHLAHRIMAVWRDVGHHDVRRGSSLDGPVRRKSAPTTYAST
jgi:hypothetical protein